MRAFDVLTKADYDIRGSTQPRYHLELALLRWVHLRRLVPLTDIIQGLDKGGAAPSRVPVPQRRSARPRARPVVKPPLSNAATVRAVETRRAEATAAKAEAEPPPPPRRRAAADRLQRSRGAFGVEGRAPRGNAEDEEVLLRHGHRPGAAHRRSKATASSWPSRRRRALKQQLEQSRPWLEEMASRLAGRKMTVVGVDGTGPAAPEAGDAARGAASGEGDQQSALKQKAMADSGVQAMLDVFRTDIKEVEEIRSARLG